MEPKIIGKSENKNVDRKWQRTHFERRNVDPCIHKKTVNEINNRICRVEERLYKLEEKFCKMGDLEIKVVYLEESQVFLSKRYEE